MSHQKFSIRNLVPRTEVEAAEAAEAAPTAAAELSEIDEAVLRMRMKMLASAHRPPPLNKAGAAIMRRAEVQVAEARANAELRYLRALETAHAPRTKKNHYYAINRFLRFAKSIGFEEKDALPTSPKLLCLFLANGIGSTGVSNAQSYISALNAWHNLQGYTLKIPPQVRLIKRALKMNWPLEKQQREVRKPISPAMIRVLFRGWKDGDQEQRCALAIATAAWMGQARLGELLPESSKSIDRRRLPVRSAWRKSTRGIAGSSTLRLPWTKTTQFKGATLVLVPQRAAYDGSTAIARHLAASPLEDSRLLCEFGERHNPKALHKQRFLQMCNSLWEEAGWPRFTGHSFRIGGTTALLLAGVDSNVVKQMGRWTSESFQLYWRNNEDLFNRHAAKLDLDRVTM